jgi:Putative auto-transporter adhesin, head GIN domain
MKKLLSLIALTALTGLITAGCHHGFADVKGSGKRETQKREVAPFTSISTEGAFNIEVVCQKDVSVEVEGDDNILPLVNTEVRGNVLRISNTKSYSVREPITFRISVPNLESILADGAGKVQITNVNNEKLQISSNGAVAINATGTTKMIGVDTNGASKIDTHNLRSAHAIVDSKGASKIDLGVCDRIDVNVSGVSHVTYRGDPVVNKSIHGPGKVEKRDSEGA